MINGLTLAPVSVLRAAPNCAPPAPAVTVTALDLMWFKKKAVLLKENNYSTEISADRTTDMRTTEKRLEIGGITIGVPSPADYFYLPALGCYDSSTLGVLGEEGLYWSSSAFIGGNAYYMEFSNGLIDIATDFHMFAMPVGVQIERSFNGHTP